MTTKRSRSTQRAGGSAPLRVDVAPPKRTLRCPQCQGTGFRRETLHQIGRPTSIWLALYILFSGVITFTATWSAADPVSLLALALSPLVLGLITVIGLVFFDRRLELRICQRCGYAFTFGEASGDLGGDAGDQDGAQIVVSTQADDDQKIVV